MEEVCDTRGVTPAPGSEPAASVGPPSTLAGVRERVDAVLSAFLEDQRPAVASADRDALVLLDEIERLVRAGGKRLRPAFCILGHLAAGGADADPIWRVAGAVELLHTFALIHDDVMDGTATRRGVPATHVRFAEDRAADGAAPDAAERFGRSAAVLAGDLATVLADQLFLESGFDGDALEAGLRRYHRMRVEAAAGQWLDLSGTGRPVSEELARRIAWLKSGSYTVEGPLQVGAALAGATIEQMAALSRYGAPLGEAFQLSDDLQSAREGAGGDGEAPTAIRAMGGGPDAVAGCARLVNALVVEARAALDPAILLPSAVASLDALAGLISVDGG
jgi:geranylgeranyl diphosphate synthase, type I